MTNFVVIDNENCIDINNIKNIDEFSIIFDSKKFFEDILISYDYNWKKILNQFKKDFHRSIITINNIQFKKMDQFIDLRMLNAYCSLNNILILLCNQSSLAFPFEKIMLYHKLLKNNMFLLDTRNNSTHINIISDNYDHCTIVINKRLKICKLDYQSDIINLYYVDVVMSFMLTDIRQKINLKNFYHLIDKYNILSWKLISI